MIMVKDLCDIMTPTHENCSSAGVPCLVVFAFYTYRPNLTNLFTAIRIQDINPLYAKKGMKYVFLCNNKK